MRDLIEALKNAGKKCSFCDKAATKSQGGKAVCSGHAKGGSGC